MRTLLDLYRQTGNRKYLEPIPRALDYLNRSRLPNGQIARFYELRSNRPLYFTREYKLTYDDSDMPTHYAFKVSDGTPAIRRQYARLAKLSPTQLEAEKRTVPPKLNAGLLAAVKAVIATQDDRGRWVEDGGLRYHRPKDPSVRVLRCETFNRNIELLSRYLSATR